MEKRSEEEKAKQKLLNDICQYRNDRVMMMTDLKNERQILDKVIDTGISTPEEDKVARLACCILAADLCVEDAAMMDKTGEMKELLRSPDIIDDLLE